MLFDYPTYPVIVLAALLAMTTYGIVVSRRTQKRTAAEYFLGARSLGAFGAGSSLFVTSILGMWLLGALHGGDRGPGMAALYGILAIVVVIILGSSFAPLYRKSLVITVPEFLSLRFNATTGVTFSGLTILFSIGVKIPLILAFASWTMKNALGWNMATSAALIVVVMSIGLYTIMGGFASVVRTQMLQAGVVLGGIAVATGSMLMHPLRAAGTIGLPPMPDMPLAMVIGLPILLAWHWWADQYTIQRILAVRDIDTARQGAFVCAAFMAALLLLVLGSAAFTGHSPVAYLFAGGPWLREIGSIVFLALLMATLASEFHSTATLFAMDMFKGVYADASEESVVLAGRLSTTVVVAAAILAVSAVSTVDGQLLALMQQVQVRVAPPIVAVLVLGMLWRRMNGTGALCAVVAGELFGALDLLARLFGAIGPSRLEALYDWGSMHLFSFGIVSLLFSVCVLVIVSLFTAAPSADHAAYISTLRRRRA